MIWLAVAYLPFDAVHEWIACESSTPFSADGSLGAWKDFPCGGHRASIPPCLDSCGPFASISSNTSAWTIATVLFFEAAWKLQENKRQKLILSHEQSWNMALPCPVLSGAHCILYLCIKANHLGHLIAAKCYKPSLLQIYAIYWANWFQFSRYFSSTLFVQDTVLCGHWRF